MAGDYGVIPLGVPYSWYSVGDLPAVWSDVYSPSSRAHQNHDTYRPPDIATGTPVLVDPPDLRTRSALLVYSATSLTTMVESDLGPVRHTMFMVQYEPTGVAGPHDHPLDEAYLIMAGEVETTFGGCEVRMKPDDIA